MLRGRNWLVLGVVPAIAACSLVYASDLDDARRLVPDAAGAEAGTPAVERGDASAEAGPVPGATGCARYPAAQFCDDFDDKLNVSDGWDSVSLDDPARVLFDSVAYSEPRSFRALLTDASDCLYGRLEKTWTGIGTRRVRASFRMRPQGPWRGGAGYAFLAATGCSIVMGLNENGPSVGANINAQYDMGTELQNDVRQLEGAPYPEEWTDVIYELTPSDGHAALKVSFVHPDGGVTERTHDLPQCRLTGELHLDLGYHCSSGTHAIRYDDVRVEWE